MKIISMKSIYSIFFVLGMLVLFTDCKDPVEGCTDANAENYDADADESDGTCVYARDKFLGEYIGDMMCTGGIIPDAEGFTIQIRESLNGDNAVEIEFIGTAAPMPILLGTADADQITVPEESYSVALDPDFPDIKTDILMSAIATLSNDDNQLNATVELTLFGTITIICDVVATRQ